MPPPLHTGDRVAPGVPVDARPATRAVHRLHRATTRPTIAILVAAAVLVMWIVVAALGFDEHVEFTFDTVCAGITVTMVFVLQHTQRREQAALQLKLDELVRALPQARRPPHRRRGVARRGAARAPAAAPRAARRHPGRRRLTSGPRRGQGCRLRYFGRPVVGFALAFCS